MNGQKMIRLIGLIAVLAALISTASAHGFSQVENDLEFRVDYPIEVKIGSCVTISFWMKASQNLTDLVVSFAIYYHQNSEVETLYSEVIVSADQVDVGWTKSKSIQVCVPREEPVDPYLRAKLEFRYKVDGEDRELDHEWYMSVVRAETYSELESEVASLRDKVSSLRDRVSELKDEIRDLEDELEAKTEELESLQEEYQSLLAEYSALEASYQQLKKDYLSLQGSYSSLSKSHQSTLIELEKLKTSYESLSKQYERLEERYQTLLGDYELTLSELRAYKAMYSDLKSRHEDLRARHDDLIAEAASLRQKIADLEEEYSYLNRMYQATLGESSLAKSVLLAQTAAFAAGLGIYVFLSRRIARRRRSTSIAEEGNSKKVQKILSGRRVTIPSDIASKLGLRKGDEVEVDYADGMIIMKPFREAGEEKESGSGQGEGGSSES